MPPKRSLADLTERPTEPSFDSDVQRAHQRLLAPPVEPSRNLARPPANPPLNLTWLTSRRENYCSLAAAPCGDKSVSACLQWRFDHGRLLMLGTGSLGWTLLLAALMAIEKNARWGKRLSMPLGVALLSWAVILVAIHA